VREGVERAAENVLGDEAEALRRAQDTVRELAKQLQDEAARAAPEKAQEPAAEEKAADGRKASDAATQRGRIAVQATRRINLRRRRPRSPVPERSHSEIPAARQESVGAETRPGAVFPAGGQGGRERQATRHTAT